MQLLIPIEKRLLDLVCKLVKMNEAAACSCQKLCFNGFKRWHKCYIKNLEKIKAKIRDCVYEQYDIELYPEYPRVDYNPQGIIYHFTMFLDHIEKDIVELGEINKDYYNVSGFHSKYSCRVHKILKEQVKKCRKMINRYKNFSSEATALHDLHMVDDRIHEKLKEEHL